MKSKDKIKNIDLYVQITDIENHVKNSRYKLPPNKSYQLIIDYPVENPVKFEIKTGKNGLSQIDLINKIGDCYYKVYKNDDKYGVWGHDIGDLVLAGIKINHTTKTIRLEVDS